MTQSTNSKGTFVYLDFEYSESKDRVTKRLVCVSIKVGRGNVVSFDLTDPRRRNLFKRYFEALCNGEYIFNCFSLDAEFNSLLHLGIDTYHLPWIDWAVEARMIMLTHPRYLSNRFSLLSACKKFRVKHRYKDEKTDVRDLILSKEEYTDEEMAVIMDYCESDVEALSELVPKVVGKFNMTKMEERIQRGEFCKACSYASFHTKGLPIDKHFLDVVYDNKDKILRGLYIKVNHLSGLEIFRQNKDESWTRSTKAFEIYLKSAGLFDRWEKTKTNKAATREEVFEKFLSDHKNHEVIGALYTAIQTKKSLSSTDYRDIMTKDGYVKPVHFPFNQKTGRSSPKPKLGFALNLQPWMRRMIQPKEGMCLVAADWGKQEIAIAAALSDDVNYKNDYYGDIYVETAKLCNLIPKDGDKNSHPDIRQKFKSIVLGMGYGKQEESVATDFETIYGMSKTVAEETARKLFVQREFRYPEYFDWINTEIKNARSFGYYKALDGWIYYTEPTTPRTRLQNLPMQSNGAAIMRRGFIRAVEMGLDVICPLHDALYINSPLGQVEEDKEKLIEAMRLAVVDILGDKITIQNDVKIYYPNERFKDSQGRDETTLKFLSEFDPQFKMFLN